MRALGACVIVLASCGSPTPQPAPSVVTPAPTSVVAPPTSLVASALLP